jgi:hypothetical protein
MNLCGDICVWEGVITPNYYQNYLFNRQKYLRAIKAHQLSTLTRKEIKKPTGNFWINQKFLNQLKNWITSFMENKEDQKQVKVQ